MASTSGSVYGNNVDGSEGSYLDWQLGGQSVSGNYSLINWQAGWRFSTTSCRGLRLGEAYINDTNVYYNHNGGDGVHGYVSGHNHKPKLQTASGQITVYHNGDGTKNGMVMTVRMTGYSGLLSEANGWFDLPSLATVPPAPQPVRLTNIGSTSLHASFYSNGDGGSQIYEWSIAYGTDPNYNQLSVSASDADITGLTPGTTYYFWARGRNAQGWGGWSSRTQATTLRVPDAPSTPTISSITQVSAVASFTPNGNGGAAITAYQIGYGTNSSGPTTTIAATSPQAITGLQPGTKYYFWARAQNSVGWGPWSAVTVATTIAGARINVGGVWQNAVPYVNVNGTWKVARTWGRSAGVWKESI